MSASAYLLGPDVQRVFLTGGAGFIGSHVADLLLEQGYFVTCYDNMSSGRAANINRNLVHPRYRSIQGDILDLPGLVASIGGHDLVWHLAANTDIIGSHEQPDRDLRDCTIGTFNVLESMRQVGIKPLIFASSGAVYGDLCHDDSVAESAGPLLPVSTYGAGKIGSEAFISSYCSVYGLRAWMYRFGNVIGARMTHGVIYDFVNKLRANPDKLVIRGDGRQEKNYFLVEECIDGMAFGYRSIPLDDTKPCDVFNLGTSTVSRVTRIAEIIREEMGLTNATIEIEGSRRAWPGDQPRVHFTVDKIGAFGWRTRYSSDESVLIAVRRLLSEI